MNTSTTTPDPLADCARRLESLVRRTSAFVAHQLGQLDDIGLQMAVEARQSATTDADESALESRWTQQKTEEQERIEEQLEHLAKAWKELESEQRRLLTLERSPQAAGFDPMTAALPDSAPEGGTDAIEPVPARRSRDLIDASAPQDAAAAALQFQKLKREIRQQSRRQR